MAFKRLSMYSASSLPRAGMATEHTLCENIDGYEPYDVSGAEGVIASSKINSVISESKGTLSRAVDSLNTAWGTKFVSIDGKDLNIVKPEKFTSYFNYIGDDVEDQLSKAKSVISKVESGTSEVKSYVSKLKENLENYRRLKNKQAGLQINLSSYRSKLSSERNKDNPNVGTVANLESVVRSCNSELREVNAEIELYEMAKISEPDGQWVVG